MRNARFLTLASHALTVFVIVAAGMTILPFFFPSVPMLAPAEIAAIGFIGALAAAAAAAFFNTRLYEDPLAAARKQLADLRNGGTPGPAPLDMNAHRELSREINALGEKIRTDAQDFHRIERMRSEFLGNTSHELRTPIFALQGFIETLIDGAIDDPEVNRKFLDRAYHQTLRLKELLDDLIEISRIESGEMRFSLRFFDLKEFSRSVLEEMAPAAEQRNVSLRLEAPERDIELFADRERLRQVLVNLIDNGMKYNRAGGEVCLALSLDPGHVRIEVRDTGIGIAAEHLDRIFERFYRVDRDRSREVGGTGLGLAIVKHLVQAHGGTVEVASEPGRGSVFLLTFPRKR